jgi:hypothetical protein
MNDTKYKILGLPRLPARLTVDEVACLFNCQPHDIPVLVRARLLKPIGDPPKNGKKMFATDEVQACMRDPVWLRKMTNAIHAAWRRNNESRACAELAS